MRVIAGKLRGAQLMAPAGTHTRPITDRVKESLFSIVTSRLGTPGFLPDMDVLDLFAGSGGLGIESLSRGSRSCLFVERDRRSLRVLRANLERLRLTDVARVAAENAWTMRIPPVEPEGYGLIFVDPPYRDVEDSFRMTALLERLAPRLSDGGLVAFRHAVTTAFSVEPLESLRCVDDRSFGGMRILLLERVEAVGPDLGPSGI